MSQQKKLLTNFDFSGEGHHVALVTAAANGKTKPLIVKKAPVNKSEGEELVPSGLKIEMTIEDFLVYMDYMYPEKAFLVANSIKKSAESDANYDQIVKALSQKLIDVGANPSSVQPAPAPVSKTDAQPKTEDTNSMTAIDKPSEQGAGVEKAAETVALEKKYEDLSEVLKSVQAQLQKHQDAEELRKTAKFGAMVVKYAAIGAVETDAEVLKRFAEQEGFDRVLGMLDSAVETLQKADLLAPVGAEGDSREVTTIDELQEVAKGYMEADKGLTIQKAMVKAAISHPHLVK